MARRSAWAKICACQSVKPFARRCSGRANRRTVGAKLPRPAIADGEYRFERVNVARQRLDFDSFLNWTERAIRTRKECPEFGWGDTCFLETDDPAVMAHVSCWRGHSVAAVHNFSRAMKSVAVKWPKGVEELQQLFGR